MKDILASAAELQRFCQKRAWRFCFIGGIAVQRWGEPRFTHDADLTLLTGFGNEEGFIDALLSEFSARFEGERDGAVARRVLRLNSSSGMPLDIALGGLPFEERSIERASIWKVPDQEERLVTCSAEDLIVHKSFAGRDLDWLDVRRVVARQSQKLNLEQIWSELRPLVELKEEPAILEKLQCIFDEELE